MDQWVLLRNVEKEGFRDILQFRVPNNTILEKLVIQLWGIWKERTAMTHQQGNSMGVVDFTKLEWPTLYWEHYCKAQEHKSDQVIKKAHYNSQLESRQGGLTLMTDAGYDKDKNKFTIGYVIRDDNGRRLGQGMESIGDTGSPKGAEFMAIYIGLCRAREKGFTINLVLSDSMEAISAIKEMGRNYKPEGYIIDRIRQLRSAGPAWEIKHIPTQFNMEAHKLANRKRQSCSSRD